MGKSTMSMAIFYVTNCNKLPEGAPQVCLLLYKAHENIQLVR